MTINYSAIQSILDTQLQTTTDLPTFSEENKNFKPTATEAWCRSTLLPAETEIIGVGQGGQRKDQGLYQIDLFYPQNDGITDVNAMADTILSNFTRGTYYSSGNDKVLIESCFRLPAVSLQQSSFYRQPLMIKWSYYTTN